MLRIPVAVLTTVAALALPPAAAAAPAPVDLEFLGRTAALGVGGAEISAYDVLTERAFVTNAAGNSLDIYDLRDPASPALVRSVDLSPYGGGPNSVDVSPREGGIVAVAIEADEPTDPGNVQFFDTDGDHINGIEAGALPDMVTFTPDGRTLLVANEGERSSAINPEGTVTIIAVTPAGLTKRTATFAGVPTDGPVRDFTGSLAADAEPEYITTRDGRTAFVSLQEINAIGILDIRRARFTVVRSLGFKDHGLDANALDPSDRDDDIAINPYANLFGMHQPDAIAAYSVGGRTYVATANEGDALADGSEESRVNGLDLDPDAFPDDLDDNSKLGRLTVTKTMGDTDGDGDYDELYAFGGRSMSLLDANARVVYDTGSELERTTEAIEPGNFNTDNTPSPFDNRSDNKGPEPEGVAVGSVGGRTYAFLAAERSGALYAYDLSDRAGRASLAGYESTRTDDLGPEGVRFVPGFLRRDGKPLLLVTNEISGTLAAYTVTPG